MVIVSLRQHFPARIPEWWMSLMLLGWGIYVVLHPGMFTNPASSEIFSGMSAMAEHRNPAGVWGLSTVVIGLIRAFALFVNGAYTRTPLIRLMMSILSAFLWTQVTVGFYKSGIENPALWVYPCLVLLDVASAYRASVDMVYAEKVRQDIKTQRRLSRDGRVPFA